MYQNINKTGSLILIGVNERVFPIDLMGSGLSPTLLLQQADSQTLLTPSSLSWQSVHMHNSSSAEWLIACIIFHFNLLLHLCFVSQQD